MKFLPPYKDVEKYREIPVSDCHSHLRLPLFEDRQIEGRFGCFISQKFNSGSYSIQRHCFFIDKPTYLYALPSSHMLTINYMLRGSPIVKMPTANLVLTENTYQLFYVPPVRHEIWFDKGEYESIHVTFDQTLIARVKDLDESLAGLYESMFHKSELINPHDYSGIIDHSMMRLLMKAISPKNHRGNMELHARSIITQLFLQYLKRVNNKKETPYLLSPLIRKNLQLVRDYIHSNFMERLTLQLLSSRCGIPVSTIKRHFPKVFGMPVSEYLLKYRMDKGMDLLSRGSCNVSEVSDLLGYSHPSAFCKAFKNYHNICAGKIVGSEQNHG